MIVISDIIDKAKITSQTEIYSQNNIISQEETMKSMTQKTNIIYKNS